VIGILADQILNRRNIGSSFRKLPYEFSLEHNVKVYIYEKISEIRMSNLNNLSELFITYYPDKKDIFKINTSRD
jgi:hypothetical protein